MKAYARIVTLIITTSLSCGAIACGDSLYRVGKGVAYRTYSAPLPGNLLVYGGDFSAADLARQLADSGHTVVLVDDEENLIAELNKGKYDVVIAPYSEHGAIEAIPGQSEFLPIATNDEEERLAKSSYKQVMLPGKHEVKHYLKAIHLSLKSSA